MKQDVANRSEKADFLLHPVVLVFSTIIMFFICQLTAALFLEPLKPLVVEPSYQTLLFIFMNVMVLYAILSISKSILGFKWRALGWNNTPLKGYLAVIPAFFIYFLISFMLTFLTTKLFSSFDSNQVQDTGFNDITKLKELIAAFIALVVITPVFEETVFRGFLFKGLRKKLPFWAVACIVSALFAFAHGQWNVALDTFVLSLILCFLAEKTHSLIPSILLHSLKNMVAFTALFIIK